jgi:hypothetical protein
MYANIRPLENWLTSSSVLLLRSSGKFTTLYIFRTAHARVVFFSVRSGAVVSQDHSAVSVSTVRFGVQLRRPKAASPPQELEVRAAGGRANFELTNILDEVLQRAGAATC